MRIEQHCERLSAPAVVSAILDEFSAVTNYRTLRDNLPRRLANIIRCRCVLVYQRVGETLQFAAGTFDDKPGWSTALLAVAHINPISLGSDTLEARAWRERQAVTAAGAGTAPAFVAIPLIYRQRVIGVLVAIRGEVTAAPSSIIEVPDCWGEDEVEVVEAVAGIVAMLLENTRLLERDRERIAELSLLNSISSQMNSSLPDGERVRSIVIQRTREISSAELCTFLLPSAAPAESTWVTSALWASLMQHFQQRHEAQLTPLLLERPGNAQDDELLNHLPTTVKTFFAIPLLGNRDRPGGLSRVRVDGTPKMLGVVVGAYSRPWKLRREELALLQVLAHQASAVLENMALVADVIEARNEARKLLRQVVEDQRLKALIEEEKRRLDRLASLGEMAASVAHEVRNPLASIKTSMQMLLDDLSNGLSTCSMGEDAQESASIVLKEVERVDSIVRDLLLFARPRQLHCVECNLVELNEHVLQLVQAQYVETGITIRRIYHTVPVVWVDLAQMEQILLNLYINALQAMPDGGMLTVSCQVVRTPRQLAAAPESDALTVVAEERERYNALEIGAPVGKYNGCKRWLELSVSDTGVGITSEQLERIFQPFFTTKAHGIGLGLPITRRLVEDHNGYILVESQPGCGATLSVRLPLDDA